MNNDVPSFNMLQSTVGYLNMTRSRTTWNAEPEIGPDRSGHTQWNLQLDWYGSWFGPPRRSGSGCWTGAKPNRPGFPVRTRTAGMLPGPIANTSTDWFWDLLVHMFAYGEPLIDCFLSFLLLCMFLQPRGSAPDETIMEWHGCKWCFQCQVTPTSYICSSQAALDHCWSLFLD